MEANECPKCGYPLPEISISHKCQMESQPYKVPCTCIKGGYRLGVDGEERVYGDCNGTEYVSQPSSDKIITKEMIREAAHRSNKEQRKKMGLESQPSREGWGIEDLLKEFSICYSSVWRWLAERSNKPSAEDWLRDKIISLLSSSTQKAYEELLGELPKQVKDPSDWHQGNSDCWDCGYNSYEEEVRQIILKKMGR
ncbi:MAG: hypothetical protein KGL39_45965 [Patescibacteria group bacterium]|nr:hypothetical protein [Patescibacteria group bacterium]